MALVWIVCESLGLLRFIKLFSSARCTVLLSFPDRTKKKKRIIGGCHSGVVCL